MSYPIPPETASSPSTPEQVEATTPTAPVPQTPAVDPDEPAAAEAGSSFGDILSEYEQSHTKADSDDAPAQGVRGTIVTISEDQVFVDIGRKTEGVLSLGRMKEAAGKDDIQVNDQVIVNITGRNEEGYYTLAPIHVHRPKDYTGLKTAFEQKQTVVGTVSEAVKGGLRVDVGARAFLPASRSGTRDQGEMAKLVGTEIQVRITKLEFDGEELKDCVVDRRVILEEEQSKAKERRFGEITEGLVIKGTVRSVTDFGAFVDLGGVDGLLHVTDMSWHRVGKPSEVVSVGESVEVKVLKANPNTRKISLGMKQLIPDPWTQAMEKFKVGDRVQGKVVRLADFGAFVELAPGVDGLIHLSEMSWSKKIHKASDVVKAGENVDVVVLGVNAADKRISLGLKQAMGNPWDGIEQKHPVGSVVEAKVVSLQKFGAFVDLGEGIEGMIHIGDISREKRLEHPKEMLAQDQVVKAQVLEIDKERRRIRLGMKQLEPTSADEYMGEHQVGEVVTGRIVDVSGNRVKVELGDGVHGICRLHPPEEKKEKKAEAETGPAADVSALSAMLSAKWKQGKGGDGGPAKSEGQVRSGQIRSFKIVTMDAQTKRIDLELAG